MSSTKAFINNKLLKEVRENFGLTLESTSKNILSSEKLENVELGKDYLTFNQLKQLANKFKLPISYFYLNENNKLKLEENFRSLKSQSIEMTPELHQTINLAHFKRDLVIEFDKYVSEEFGFDFMDILSLADDIKISAKKIKSFLNIDSMKSEWKDKYKVLKSWINELTRLGILIFQISSIPVENMRGFSISKKPYPVIMLNNKDGPLGRVFSLIHELVHLALKDDEELAFSIKIKQTDIETFCNKVTAEILMPEEEFLTSQIVLDHRNDIEWTDEELIKLHKIFWVSKEAILTRLVNLKLAKGSFYNRKVAEWSSIIKKADFGLEIHKRVINQNSKLFLNTILTAFHENEINSAKLSSLLNLKLKHLEKLENEIRN